jgi:nucleoside-diphosphate kinase
LTTTMLMDRTLAILKPDVTANALRWREVLARIRGPCAFEVMQEKKVRWKRAEAEAFYAEHQHCFFYTRLVDYMTR